MSIHFTCPHCNSTTDVADQSAGQAGTCGQCGQAVNVPMDGRVVSKPNRSFRLDLSSRSLFNGLLLILLIAGCDAIGVGIGVFLPAVQAAREAARRTQCTNQLKQIGLALLNYEQQYKCFPPAFIPDENGKPKHSWRVLILPFLERGDLYEEYRFDEPWDGPHNKMLAEHMPRGYRCPNEADARSLHTSYAMIVGPHAISDGPTGRTFGSIKDGAANTILVAEAAGAGINWMEPRDLNTEAMTFQLNPSGRDQQSSKTDISSEHSGTFNVLLCNGSVRSLSATLDPTTLRALMTIDGGETIKSSDF